MEIFIRVNLGYQAENSKAWNRDTQFQAVGSV